MSGKVSSKCQGQNVAPGKGPVNANHCRDCLLTTKNRGAEAGILVVKCWPGTHQALGSFSRPLSIPALKEAEARGVRTSRSPFAT